MVLLPEGIEVRDDGRGIPEDALRGNGLVGLAERARLAGATMTLGPGPQGRGTVLRVLADRSVQGESS